MVDSVWPVDAVSGAPSYSGRKLRQSLSPLVAGATAARPLGARSGVRPGTSPTTVTASSSTWTCGPFAGVADAESSAIAGPYEFAFDASASGALTAAVGSPRTDIVWVRIDDPAESDGTSVPVAVRGYTAGTATPPARAFVIAQINVPASGGGSPTVTWVAPYAVAAGGVMPVDTLAHLNALQASVGQHATVYGDSTANNGDYIGDGTDWNPADTLPHAEFTATVTVLADSTLFSSFAYTADASKTTDSTLASIVSTTPGPTNRVRLSRPGMYAISFMGTLSAISSGRCAILIASPTGTDVARSTIAAAENVLSVSEPAFYASAANTEVTLSLIKTTGGNANFAGRVRITRLGS